MVIGRTGYILIPKQTVGYHFLKRHYLRLTRNILREHLIELLCDSLRLPERLQSARNRLWHPIYSLHDVLTTSIALVLQVGYSLYWVFASEEDQFFGN